MFRELYKSANEEIKGDRAILEKAFMKAEEPERKPLPVFKYSFVGTAVAAVIIVGALFANTDLFTDKINDIPKQNADITATEAPNAENDSADINKINDLAVLETPENSKQENVENTQTAEQKIEGKSAPKADTTTADNAKADNAKAGDNQDAAFAYAYTEEDDAAEPDNEDMGISVTSINDEDYDTDQSTEAPAVWGVRKAVEEDGYAETDDWSDEFSTEGMVASTSEKSSGGGSYIDKENGEEKMFSYMYDLSVYGEKTKTENFVNTAVSPVTNEAEAIERAKSECTIGYDNVEAYYDKAESMWKVVFTGENAQSVYMNTDGVTTLIVYGK